MQLRTMFSQLVFPWERGTTWSRLSSLLGNGFPQYWQVLQMRTKMLRRLKRTLRRGTRSYATRTTTRGILTTLPTTPTAGSPAATARALHDG